MDTLKAVPALSRELYRRGTHRGLGNPFLGTVTAFLTLIFLIRIAANLFLGIDLARKGSEVDSVQIASAHFVLLSAYLVWIGALATARTGRALPRLCFVTFAPQGRRFRARFLRQVAARRPMNVASAAITIFTALAFSMISGTWQPVASRALFVVAYAVAGMVVVSAVASWAARDRSELQLLELLFLLALVALNPDIGSFEGRVAVFFGGIHLAFHSLWEIGAAVGFIVGSALLLLLLIRVLSAFSRVFRGRLSLRPIERWYWRFVRIRSWVLLYLLITPILVSSAISAGTKRWALALSVLFGAASYLYFIAHCDNTVREKWRCSLLDKGNLPLITRSVLIHGVLTVAPLCGYLAARWCAIRIG